MRDLLAALDDEGFAIVGLCVFALERNDMRLVEALAGLAKAKPGSSVGQCREIDLGLIARIRAICANTEKMFWANVLAAAELQNDNDRLDRLRECIQIRTAD